MGTWCEYPPEMYNELRVKARKEHKCCETCLVIKPGQYYWRIVGVWEGTFSTYAQSEAAYHFARYLNRDLDSNDHCVPFGHVDQEMENLGKEETLYQEWQRVQTGEITRPGC